MEGKHFEAKLFICDDVTIITWFYPNTNPKWPVIVAFLSCFALVWTENIGCFQSETSVFKFHRRRLSHPRILLGSCRLSFTAQSKEKFLFFSGIRENRSTWANSRYDDDGDKTRSRTSGVQVVLCCLGTTDVEQENEL